MHPSIRTTVVGGLSCQACGRLPHARRGRLGVGKLAAVFPVELALRALVLHHHPPYLLAVALLSVSTTRLIVWVVEPSAMRMLRTWLHAPQLSAAARLGTASALWRMRVTAEDHPGALEQIAHALAGLDAIVLDLQVHPLQHAVRDELIFVPRVSLEHLRDVLLDDDRELVAGLDERMQASVDAYRDPWREGRESATQGQFRS